MRMKTEGKILRSYCEVVYVFELKRQGKESTLRMGRVLWARQNGESGEA